MIYNLTDSLEEGEDPYPCQENISNDIIKEIDAMKLKKMKFLIHSYLQYCAILSQINKLSD